MQTLIVNKYSPRLGEPRRMTKYPWALLAVGDRMDVVGGKAEQLYVLACNAGKRLRRKFRVSRYGPGGAVRVTRVR